jgi:hypothetical protein
VTTADDLRAKRILYLGFGILWLVDGLLQFLPEQGPNTIAMLAMGGWGQPAWLLNLVDMFVNAIHLNGLDDAFSVAMGIAQGAVGVLILFGPDRRPGRVGLYASIPLATVFWVVGEWMGGIMGFWTGGITFVNGGPGAVMLYLLGAVCLLPAGRVFGKDLMGRLRRLVGGLWILGALLQSAPPIWQSGLSDGFAEVQVITRQGFWTVPIGWMAHAAAQSNALWNGLFVAVMLALGLGILLERGGAWLYLLAGVWLLFVWWIGENFGGLPSLATTDPNSGPAWAVLMLPLFLATLARGRARTHGREPDAPAEARPAG